MRKFGLVEHDRGGLRPYLRGKGDRIGFQRQMLAVGADDIELVVIAGAGVRNEQLPIAGSAHAHRVPARIPVVEIADHADAPGIRRQHHESDAVHALQRHRMRAELVVDALMGAFAEQIKVDVAQHRRKAIGIVEFDDIVAEPRPQLIALRAVRHRAGKQAGIVDSLQRRGLAVFADGVDLGGLRQKCAHHALAALAVQSEIVEGIGMTAFDDRIGFGR